MNKDNYYEVAPLSEQTLKKHKYNYKGAEFHNDFGYPCDYRVVVNNEELGIIKYYMGRKLMCYEL